MVFWKIILANGRVGWQIMNADLSDAKLYDDAGALLTGGFDYSVVGEAAAPPTWWVG